LITSQEIQENINESEKNRIFEEMNESCFDTSFGRNLNDELIDLFLEAKDESLHL
jgi:hypothetical protein